MPDTLQPDYISLEEIEQRRRGDEERQTQRYVLLLHALGAVVLVLCELYLW